MSKREKITQDMLMAMVSQEVEQSYGYGDGRLEELRRRNEYFFMAEAKGELAPPEVAGRSRVVDTTLRNTVLGMEGPLMKTFYGSDNIFEFEETKPGLEEQAKNISEYVNHIYRKKNNGYVNTNTWIREALNIKSGILKVWWDPTAIEAREEYTGMTAEQIAMLLDDPEVEIVEQKSYPDEEAEAQKAKGLEQAAQQLAQMQEAANQEAAQDPTASGPAVQQFQQAYAQYEQMQAQPVPELFDVVMKRKTARGKVCIEPVPPEEFLISKRAKSIPTSPFCAHRFVRTISQLKNTPGYKVPDDLGSDDDEAEFNPLRIERVEYIDDDPYQRQDGMDYDPCQRSVWVVEAYMQVDWDGDGIPEWRKIVKCGDVILANDEFDEPPFVALGSILMPHMFYGICPADLAVEPQKIKTSLKRGQLDNMYLQINGRTAAVENQVNLDDLLSNVPGGIVRVKSLGAVAPLQQGISDIGGSIALMQVFDDDSQESTGWTRRSQGGNGLSLQQTATQANIVTNREDMRVESISRYMAETGFTALGNMILKLITRYQKKSEMIKVAGTWVNMDPREWTNQFNLEINVGLGTGNKDQLVQHLMLTGQKQAEGLQIGVSGPQQIYNLNKKLTNALGFKNGDEFFTDPSKQPPPQPPQDPAVVKAQMDDQKHQREMEYKAKQAEADRQAMLQTKQMEADMQMAVDRNRQTLEAEQQRMKAENEAALEAQREQNRMQEAMAKIEFEREKLAFEKYKADLAQQTAIVTAQISAKQQGDMELMRAEEAANQGAADGNA